MYALLQELRIVNDSRIQPLIVVGDSKAIISQMVVNTTLVDNLLASVLAQAKQEANKINNIKYYHVLRENNLQFDGLANVATSQMWRFSTLLVLLILNPYHNPFNIRSRTISSH
jgi:hypothetical protein